MQKQKTFLTSTTVLPVLLTACAISFFVFSAIRSIDMPGLQYDEVLFVNAALGGIDDSFIHKRVGRVPVMLMPYLGALKAYLYFPIFKLLGVSPQTIRVPAILLSALTLWIAFLFSRKALEPWPATGFVWLMATDPVFIFSSKLDWGPAVLMLFFKMLALYFFFSVVKTSGLGYWWALVFTLFLGLYDKLNFIWFAAALAVGGLAFYPKTWLELQKRNWKLFLLPIVISALSAALLLGRPLVHSIALKGTGVEWPDKLWQARGLYEGTMNGRAIYELLMASHCPVSTYANYFLVAALIAVGSGAVLFAIPRLRGDKIQSGLLRASLFIVSIGILIVVQIILTPQAGGPHHALMVYPLHHFLIAAAGLLLATTLNRFIPKAGTLLVTGILSILVWSQLATVNEYWKAFAQHRTFDTDWSPEIYGLAEYLNHNVNRVDSIISADWGFHTQLMALGHPQSRTKYLELWTIFNDLHEKDAQYKRWVHETFFEKKRLFVLLRAHGLSELRNVRQNFSTFASEFSLHTELVRRFEDAADRRLYEVFLVY